MPVAGNGVGDGGRAVSVRVAPGVVGTEVTSAELAAVRSDAEGAVEPGGGSPTPSGRATAATTRSEATRMEAATPAVRAERNEPSTALNYYTACGMSEYTSAPPKADPVEQPVSDVAQVPGETTPAGAPTPARRTVIGPFTARQIGLVNAIVVGAALVLFVATRPLGSDAPTTTQPGASFYRISAETQGLQLGQRAPDFVGRNGDQDVRLTDLDGREIRLADFAGKPVWVVFWATWCPPCQQETPDIRAVYEANRDAGLVVVAVDVQEPADTIREYAQRYGLTFTIGVDTYAAIMKTYGVFGLPTHYFIDRQGVIRDRYFGPLKRDQMQQRVGLISKP